MAADVARPQGAAVRILGIDPGLRHTGWGVIDAEGNRLRFVASGAVEPGVHGSMSDRLHRLFVEVRAIIDSFKPHECAIEDTFVNKNPQSTLKLGHARAAAMLAPAERGLAVFEYKPNLVKKSVVGAGHAEKDQVAAMVRMLMPGSDAATKDAADALAVAICHAHHRASALRLVAAR
ncbi:MAG: crossover junction endodeoxyribonuclease RuvC [Rhodobacteraceae bacterium]|nr:crossover junction endodeoxyribonuclease RuvC [Paracoccaceae bacterium]